MQFLQRKKDVMQNCLQRAASDFTSSSRVANTDETRGVLSSVLVDIGIVVYRAGAGFPESYDRGYRAMLVDRVYSSISILKVELGVNTYWR